MASDKTTIVIELTVLSSVLKDQSVAMSLGWFDTEAYFNANDVTKYKEVMIVFFAGQGTTTGYEKFKTLTAFDEHKKTA